MEGVETVDVSWLHHSQKDNNLSRCRSASSFGNDADTTAAQQAKPEKPPPDNTSPIAPDAPSRSTSVKPDVQNANSRADKESRNGESTASNGTIPSSDSFTKTAPKSIGRRGSWISSISSKFSSGSTPPSQSHMKSPTAPKASPTASKLDMHNPFGAAYSPKDKEEEKKDENTPFTSSSPRGPSFLQSAFRKLSSSGSGGGKPAAGNGAVCERRTLNIDKERDRCKVPNLNPAKLRRVAFCVDVEIAGIAPRDYDEESPSTARRHVIELNGHKPKRSNSKSKSKDEAELKLSQPTTAEKETPAQENGSPKSSPPATPANKDNPKSEAKEPTRKQEKKKRSEEERRERKERKRRLAEANGSIPLQLTADDHEGDPKNTAPGGTRPGAQSHPTTDPVRIYRRCCQLRETPVLKRIVDEISSPSSTLAESPGTVAVLNLTNFPMTSEDMATFSDWLAVVPVRKLILEKCALTDDAVRSILSALLSTKTVEQMRRRRGKNSGGNVQPKEKIERYTVVEKLSLKDNSKIGTEGWRHISLFIHLAKSLKAIDLSGIPLPKATISLNDATNLPPRGMSPTPASTHIDVAAVFSNSLSNRFGGDHLEELLLSECKPTMDEVKRICEAATTVGLRRLGLANNGVTREGLQHVVRYLESGKCEGLDLGGNPIGEDLDLITDAIESHLPLYALSLADCSLTPSIIYPLLQAFTQLPNIRFIDFSHNPALFSTLPDALSTFRRFLPKMPNLKRIHLADVNLSSDHTIALAEILPECRSLSHLSILENPAIVALASATDPEAQEEACAVYASLLAAVRVSRTIIAVDIEDPSAENNEVVKALASQIVAYCLHNLEGGAIEELSENIDPSQPRTTVPIPEILQHIVGNGTADEGLDEDDELAPDEDYVIGGTGVVKALGVCLGNLDQHMPGDLSGPPSGTTTPRHRKSRSLAAKRPRDMSKNLLESARGIRTRIESALVREDRAGNDDNYRRLQFLDFTLQKMIQRFEDEYPETRIIPQPPKPTQDTSSQNSGDDSYLATSIGNLQSAGVAADNETMVDDDDGEQYAVRLSRASSITSLYSRAMTSEEGHVHRLGQNIRRDFLPLDQAEEGESSEMMDESQFAALRDKLDRLHEEQTRSHFESVGADKAFQELGSTVEELWAIQRQDSEAYERFRQSQIAAQINSGRRTPSVSDTNRARASNIGRERPSAS
ncbi:hypothetical protein BDW74DRAFT_162142 [Aspergillus multicolor]|uniref:putative cell wall biogenesis protein Mhp1 n=1 Tax=Aspergillus multicolor TaxID=41759 RepID=UPI003CCD5E49